MSHKNIFLGLTKTSKTIPIYCHTSISSVLSFNFLLNEETFLNSLQSTYLTPKFNFNCQLRRILQNIEIQGSTSIKLSIINIIATYRSSRLQIFFKTDVLQNFAMFTGNACVGVYFL